MSAEAETIAVPDSKGVLVRQTCTSPEEIGYVRTYVRTYLNLNAVARRQAHLDG